MFFDLNETELVAMYELVNELIEEMLIPKIVRDNFDTFNQPLPD